MRVEIPENGPVRRSYLNPAASDFWSSLLQLSQFSNQHMKKLAEAWSFMFPRELFRDPTGQFLRKLLFHALSSPRVFEPSKAFTEPLAVDWHLDYVVREYLADQNPATPKYPNLSVKTNCFRDYHATEIVNGLEGSQKLLCPPFFEPAFPDTLDQRLDDPRRTWAKQKMKRGMQDTHLFLAPAIVGIMRKHKDSVDPLVQLFSWFEVKLAIKVVRPGSSHNPKTIDLELEADCGNHIDWEEFPLRSIRHKSWDFPGLREYDVKSGIVMSSPNVRRCVADLAATWHNRGVRKLLLIASPGSGKEVLCSLFCAARNIAKTHRAAVFAADLGDPAVLHSTLKEFKDLFATLTTDKDASAWSRPVLFADEVHQATDSVRASLLRILESDKLAVPGMSADNLDLNELIWMFAASVERTTLFRRYGPPDFWTRMDQIIELRHPLAFQDSETRLGDRRKDVLTDYFWQFWRGDPDAETESKKEHGVVRQRILRCLVDDNAFKLARKFSEIVGSPLVELFSIRYIRGMAKRIRGQAILFGLEMTPFDEEEFVKRVDAAMERWTTNAFKDIVMTRKMDGSLENQVD